MAEILYRSKLTLFAQCPIKDGYIIDSMNSFIATYPQNNKRTLTEGRIVDISKTTLEYVIDADIVEFNDLYAYNYAMIESHDNENNPMKTRFYFINDYQLINSLKRIKIVLFLDILNTYVNDLQFSRSTFVIREHKDRWGELYTKNNVTYLQKKFYRDDSNGTMKFVNSFRLYGTNPISQFDCWIKIVLSDYDGVNSYFFPYDATRWVIYNGTGYQLDTFTSMQATEIVTIHGTSLTLLRLLQAYPNIISFDLLPYPPFSEYANYNDQQPPQVNPDKFTYSEYSFTVSDISNPIVIKTLKSTYAVLGSPELDNNYIRILNGVDLDNNIIKIQEILFNLLVTRVSALDLRELKNNNYQNGFFSTFNIINNLQITNEPNTLTSGLLDIYFDFNNLEFDLILENFHYINNFSNCVNNYETNNLINDPIIDFRLYTTLLMANNLVFQMINSSQYKYESDNNNAYSTLNAEIPLISENYYQYNSNKKIEDEKKADERKLNKHNRKASIRRTIREAIKGGLSVAGDYVKRAADKIGLKTTRRAITGLLHGGTISAATLASGLINFLIGKDKENQRMSATDGGIEALLYVDKEYKMKLKIEQAENINSFAYDYYLHGVIANEYKVPEHNSRKLFDFLQCNAVFLNQTVPDILLDDINEKFSSGVIYIHNRNYEWHFPEEDLENVEMSLLNKI